MSNYKIISPGCVTIQDRNENLPTTTVYTILSNCLLSSQSKQLRQLSIYCYFRLQMLYTEAGIYTKASSAFKYLHKKPLYH